MTKLTAGISIAEEGGRIKFSVLELELEGYFGNIDTSTLRMDPERINDEMMRML